MAAIDDHRYAITYGDQNDVWVKVLDSTTGILSAEVQLDVTGGFSLNPQVSGAPGAGFVVTWAQYNGADYDVRARLFDGHANAVGSDFIVTSLTDASQFTPTVAASDHHIFFAWTDFAARPTDTAAPGIRGRSLRRARRRRQSAGRFALLPGPQSGCPAGRCRSGRALQLLRLARGARSERLLRYLGLSQRQSGCRGLRASIRSTTIDQIGWREGRDPGPNFDTTIYLLRNPDVAAAGVDPLAHYLQFGIYEGRQTHVAVGQIIGGDFDAEYYLFHNPDVAAAGVDPLLHFNIFGWHEGRNPNRLVRYGGLSVALPRRRGGGRQPAAALP